MLCRLMRGMLVFLMPVFLKRSVALMVRAFRAIGLLCMLDRLVAGERDIWQPGEQHQGEQTSEPPEVKIHSVVPPANSPR